MKLKDAVKWKVVVYALGYLLFMSFVLYQMHDKVNFNYDALLTFLNLSQFLLGVPTLLFLGRNSKNINIHWGLFFGLVIFNIYAIIGTNPF